MRLTSRGLTSLGATKGLIVFALSLGIGLGAIPATDSLAKTVNLGGGAVAFEIVGEVNNSAPGVTPGDIRDIRLPVQGRWHRSGVYRSDSGEPEREHRSIHLLHASNHYSHDDPWPFQDHRPRWHHHLVPEQWAIELQRPDHLRAGNTHSTFVVSPASNRGYGREHFYGRQHEHRDFELTVQNRKQQVPIRKEWRQFASLLPGCSCDSRRRNSSSDRVLLRLHSGRWSLASFRDETSGTGVTAPVPANFLAPIR
jgi:hypothetical protein